MGWTVPPLSHCVHHGRVTVETLIKVVSWAVPTATTVKTRLLSVNPGSCSQPNIETRRMCLGNYSLSLALSIHLSISI